MVESLVLVRPKLSVTVNLNVRVISGTAVVGIVGVGNRGATNVGLGVLPPTEVTAIPEI